VTTSLFVVGGRSSLQSAFVIAATLIHFAIGRTREIRADAVGAQISGPRKADAPRPEARQLHALPKGGGR